jgi:hypothetical protein
MCCAVVAPMLVMERVLYCIIGIVIVVSIWFEMCALVLLILLFLWHVPIIVK